MSTCLWGSKLWLCSLQRTEALISTLSPCTTRRMHNTASPCVMSLRSFVATYVKPFLMPSPCLASPALPRAISTFAYHALPPKRAQKKTGLNF
jgi:hypothetical protein